MRKDLKDREGHTGTVYTATPEFIGARAISVMDHVRLDVERTSHQTSRDQPPCRLCSVKRADPLCRVTKTSYGGIDDRTGQGPDCISPRLSIWLLIAAPPDHSRRWSYASPQQLLKRVIISSITQPVKNRWDWS